MKNKTRLFLAAFVSVLLVVPLAIPVVGEEDVEADLIVDEDWEDDGEENDDGIPVYSNLDAALDNLENGDRLLIEDGNYEWIETGLPNKSLDLIAMNKHGPNIQGSSENYGLLVAELDKDKSMKLEGLVMSDFEVPVLFSSSEGPISDVKAVGNLFEDNYRGLYARAENHDVSNIKFKDNELTRSAYPPLLVGTRDSPETTIEDVKVIGNELYDFRDDQQIAIYMQAYDGGLIRDTLIERNTIYDVYTDHESRGAIWLRGDGTDSKFESINIHWNSLQNTDIALSLNPDVNLDGNLDATLNWWGAKTGPEVYQGGDRSGEPSYSGDGEKVLANDEHDIAFSPWLKFDPDSNPEKLGVQIEEPIEIVVQNVGPKPRDKDGNPIDYLEKALRDSSFLPGKESVNINHRDITIDIQGTGMTNLQDRHVGQNIHLNADSFQEISQSTMTGKLDLSDYEGSEFRAYLNYWGGKNPGQRIVGEKSQVLYSPWLETRHDVENRKIAVKKEGMQPEPGYLDFAIDKSEESDIIKLYHDDESYELSKKISNPSTLISEEGSADKTFVSGTLEIDSDEVRIGSRGQGLTLEDGVVVTSEVDDANTVDLSWNILQDQLDSETDGTGRVDATLNYWEDEAWGEDGPEVTGDVQVSPWLKSTPGEVDTLVVDDEGLDQAISSANEQTDVLEQIQVNHGEYSSTETITSPLTVTSEKGSAEHTFIEDDLVIDSGNVYVGDRMRGFTVKGDVIVESGEDQHLNWNVIEGNLANESGSTVNAILNSWDDKPQLEGDSAVAYSPWIVGSPDAEELSIVVDKVGAEPEDGYLVAAIDGTNTSDGQDRILVNHGSYGLKGQRIESPVVIESEKGSAEHTFIEDDLVIDSGNVYVGDRMKGFTVKGDVIVESGEDQNLSWNKILGELKNRGDSTVNAVLNSWNVDEDEDPEVEGKVIYSPWIVGSPDADKLLVVVDESAGVKPKGGYLNTALQATNETESEDELRVNHGNYRLDEAITSPLTVTSEKGSAEHTFIEGDLVIDSSRVQLGEYGQGFTMKEDVIVKSGSAHVLNWNVIEGEFRDARTEEANDSVDATLNYWGEDGPEVTGNVQVSPWLKSTPGEVDTLVVDDEGLDQAISSANEQTDVLERIQVNHGEYELNESIEGPAEVHSEKGSAAYTHLHDDISLESAHILIGRKGQGFTIHDDVTVRKGVDASTLNINWNNIYGTVANRGEGTLDATYNYWGSDDPSDDTVGDVKYDPYLPTTVGEFKRFMQLEGYENPDEAISSFELEKAVSSEPISDRDLAALRLRSAGFSGAEAQQVISDFGSRKIVDSYTQADDYEDFLNSLIGYQLSPSGEDETLLNREEVSLVAASDSEEVSKEVDAEYSLDDEIEVSFSLRDYRGEKVKDEHAVVTVVRLEEEGPNVLKATSASFCDKEGSYLAKTSAADLGTGEYSLYIDLQDGPTTEKKVQIVA